MSAPPLVLFEIAGEQLALSVIGIDRVIRRPTLLRLPSVGVPDGHGTRWAAHIGDEIIPLLGAVSDSILVLRSSGGRIALGVDRVLGVGDDWAGPPVRRVTVSDFERALGSFPPPAPFLGRGAAGPARPAEPAPRPMRVLRIRAGGADWVIDAAEVVAVQDVMPLVRVPLAPPCLLGVAILRGQAVPVVTPALQDGSHAALVFVRDAAGQMAIALDCAPFWAAAGDAPRLDLDRLRAATGLTPVSEQRSAVAAAVPPAIRCSLLPVIIGGRRFGLPLPLVERVVARTAVARLPACGGRRSALSGAVAVDGRVVPMTDGGRWLSLGEDGRRPIHVLIHPDKERHVLSVDAVDRPVSLDASRLQPLRDPAEQLTGLAHLANEVLPVLDVSRIGVPP